MKSDLLKIGNAQAFWGDSSGAPAALAAQAPDLNCLTLDYLAEVSMSILARQRERDPAAGYAKDFLEVVASLAPVWKSGRKLTLVTNAGGLNPKACAAATREILRNAGCAGIKIGVVGGDNVLAVLRGMDGEKKGPPPQPSPGVPGEGAEFSNLETGAALASIVDSLVTANAYLGAGGIAEALRQGADLVITGRVADPSLTVGPCAAHFGWKEDAYDRIAGATVAGHLIECGTQVTGGISTHWLELPDNGPLGFPIVEVSDDGSCVITKPTGTGGCVDCRGVKEQLLYEIGDPEHYLGPDATVSFLSLQVAQQGLDRVRVSGAGGKMPPASYKVSATYRAGFRAAGTLAIFGRDAVAKGRRAGEAVRQKLRQAGVEPAQFLVECLGSGDVVGGIVKTADTMEVVLRVSASDPRREVVERFSRELVPLVTSGPQGTTGYFDGRPAVREVYGYWPTLIRRELVAPRVEMMQV